jgi:hypothetical protein
VPVRGARAQRLVGLSVRARSLGAVARRHTRRPRPRPPSLSPLARLLSYPVVGPVRRRRPRRPSSSWNAGDCSYYPCSSPRASRRKSARLSSCTSPTANRSASSGCGPR